MSEKNPNHAMTQAISGQWHKIAALLIRKLGVDHVVISEHDVAMLSSSSNKNITVKELDDGIHLRLVDDKRAAELIKKEGGLAH